jgi:hypothetical protein
MEDGMELYTAYIHIRQAGEHPLRADYHAGVL